MSSYQNLPLYSVNIKVFVKMGLIATSGWTKRFLSGFILTVTYIGQLINMCKTWNEDIGETGMNFYVLAMVTHTLVRFYFVMKNDEKFVRFFQCVEQWYNDIERNGDPQTIIALHDITKATQRLTRVSFYTTGVAALAAFIHPLSFDKRKLVVAVQYPFINVLETPYYEFLFLIQAVWLISTFVFIYLPFMNIFLTSLKFGEVALKDLCLKLNNIRSENESTMLKEFKECITYHGKIINLCADLEDLISMDAFYHVTLFGMMLCMLLFFLSMVNDLRIIVTVMTFIVFALYLIGVPYFYANNFATESLQVAHAVYNTPWYRGNLEMRKCVLIMIARCQKPLQIRAGGLLPMTMEHFQAILRLSYSYFSLLQGLNQ